MALAYCILAHKNPVQVARLFRAIWHPNNSYALHYERRAPFAEHRYLRLALNRYPNVQILSPRVVLWGRYSQLSVQLDALRKLSRGEKAWTHFINLTGQDFPLKPQIRIVEEMEGNPDTSFLSYFEPLNSIHWKNARERLERVHIDSPLLEATLEIPGVGRRIRYLLGWKDRIPYIPILRRSPPTTFKYMGGSNHVILSRQAANYVISDPNAIQILGRLRQTGHPDESVYQSIVLNSPFSGLTVNNDRRAIFWERAGDSNPRTLIIRDLQELREAEMSGRLFARKFDYTVDEKVISAIEVDFL